MDIVADFKTALGIREEKAEVAEVVAGGASDDGVAELVEESEGVALTEEGAGVEAKSICTRERITIGNSSCGGAVSVDAIRAGAQDGDFAARDFLHARQNKSGVSASSTVSGHRGTHLAIGNESDTMPRVFALPSLQLQK